MVQCVNELAAVSDLKQFMILYESCPSIWQIFTFRLQQIEAYLKE